MKLAISNLAWQRAEDEAVRAILQAAGVRAIEIGPTKVWPQPLDVTEADARRYRASWESHGIRIVALQSILYGRPDLLLFGESACRRAMLEYLTGIIRLARWLGAGVLVFGAIKNRRCGMLAAIEAETIAVPFFRELGAIALQHTVVVCIEPNPAVYGCDYVTTAEEGAHLVRQVGCAGFGLHLDTAGMTLSQEPIEDALERAMPLLRHLHISEAPAAPIGSGDVDHRRFAAALGRVGYSGWLSIEIQAREGGNIEPLRESIAYVAATYGGNVRDQERADGPEDAGTVRR